MQTTQVWCNNATNTLVNTPLAGNLIPHSWYKTFLTESGRPDTALISILSETFYWYRPSKAGGSKFTSDAWQTSYDHFTAKFCYSRETIRRVFVKLEEFGVAYRDIRMVTSYGQKYNNVLFLRLNHEKLMTLTECAKIKNNSADKITDNLASKKICTPNHKMYTPSPQIVGDYIEEEISYKNNLIRSDLSKSDFLNLKNSNLVHLPKNTSFNQEVEHSNNSTKEFVQTKDLVSITENLKNQSFTSKNPIELKLATSTRKPLFFFHPLSEEDAKYLRQSSGREFNLNFINKLLLKLSAKFPKDGAHTKLQLLSKYLTSRLMHEKIKPETGNLENFNFRPIKGTKEHKNRQIYKYLNTIEQSTQTDLITQIKRRIIGLSSGDSEYAFDILTNCILPYMPLGYERKKDNELNCLEHYAMNQESGNSNNENSIQYIPTTHIIKISDSITQSQKEVILKAVKEILGQGTEIIFKNKILKTPSISNIQYISHNNYYNDHTNFEFESPKPFDPEPKTLSSPLWQKVRDILKRKYGEAIDSSWFSKLDIEIKNTKNNDYENTLDSKHTDDNSPNNIYKGTQASEQNDIYKNSCNSNQIIIKAPTAFIRDWIRSNYESSIEDAIKTLSKEKWQEPNPLSGFLIINNKGMIEGLNIVCDDKVY